MWVICIINETTLYHSASAHFIITRENKENFCFLSGFPKWSVTDGSYVPIRLHETMKPQLVLPATQARMWLPSTQVPAMIYHFQMLHLTTNLRSSAFSARSFLSEIFCLHMKGQSLLSICLPKLIPIILTALQVSFIFPIQLKEAVRLKMWWNSLVDLTGSSI